MLTIGKIGISLSVLGILGIGLLDGPASPRAIEKDGTLKLTLSRRPASNEAVVVRLSVGVLPRGASVIVRTLDGEIAGSVVPFGVKTGRKAGEYAIPVPAKAIVGEEVKLRLEVMEKDAKAARTPATEEIEGAKLAFIPATPRPEKKKE